MITDIKVIASYLEDIFGPLPSKLAKVPTKSEVTGQEPTRSEEKRQTVPIQKTKKKPSLFDDDDSDLDIFA